MFPHDLHICSDENGLPSTTEGCVNKKLHRLDSLQIDSRPNCALCNQKMEYIHVMPGTWLPICCCICAKIGSEISDKIIKLQKESWDQRAELIKEWKELVCLS